MSATSILLSQTETLAAVDDAITLLNESVRVRSGRERHKKRLLTASHWQPPPNQQIALAREVFTEVLSTALDSAHCTPEGRVKGGNKPMRNRWDDWREARGEYASPEGHAKRSLCTGGRVLHNDALSWHSPARKAESGLRHKPCIFLRRLCTASRHRLNAAQAGDRLPSCVYGAGCHRVRML